jgi:hypothetical protein
MTYAELTEQLNEACKRVGVDVEFHGSENTGQYGYKLETILLFLLKREAQRDLPKEHASVR